MQAARHPAACSWPDPLGRCDIIPIEFRSIFDLAVRLGEVKEMVQELGADTFDFKVGVSHPVIPSQLPHILVGSTEDHVAPVEGERPRGGHQGGVPGFR